MIIIPFLWDTYNPKVRKNIASSFNQQNILSLKKMAKDCETEKLWKSFDFTIIDTWYPDYSILKWD